MSRYRWPLDVRGTDARESVALCTVGEARHELFDPQCLCMAASRAVQQAT